MTKRSIITDGICISGLLGSVSVVLKLTGYITWSWWLVTLPFWWWLPLLLLQIFFLGICAFVAGLYGE